MIDPLRRLRHAFRALRHRNFRLFAGSQLISLSGTWMQQVALGWLVLRLTNSPLLLGAVSFAALIPTLLSPFAGVWADRVNRHRMVIVTQVLAMSQAFALAALVSSQHARIVPIILLAAFLGCVNSAEIPARQAFVIEMIAGKQDLSSAIALNSSTFNAARFIGPAIAGLLVVWIGEGWVFFLNGLSYLVVIGALLAMRLSVPPQKTAAHEPVLRTLDDGLRYSFGFLPVRRIILLLAAGSFFGYSFLSILPVYARDVLGGGAHTFGFLVGASGLGAIAGGLALASRTTLRGLGRLISAAVATFGLALLGLACSRHLVPALLLLFVSGVGLMVHLAASNTLVQTIIDDDKRGRVMSFFGLAHMGMLSLGSLTMGALTERFGAPTAIFLGGLACLACAFWFARTLSSLRAEVQPVYERLGID